ncbi:hypothetical protein DFH28DRAFT_1055631 [Melampsora americana]|nr:hypothetical protein DFH28DRAFT_1055631 [Melampsora americana]
MSNFLVSLYLLNSFFYQSTLSISSHSPQDLLAYPKYSINLHDWNSAILNSTATNLISNLTTPSHPQSDPSSHHQLTTLDQHTDDPQQQTSIAYRQTLIRTATGQAFLCAVPPIPEIKPIIKKSKSSSELSKPDQKLKRQAKLKSEEEGLKNGLNLLEPLKDRCIYTRLGWFTYSFCYGTGQIRQFHAIMIPGHNHPHEDPAQDVFVLGLHVDHPQHPNHQAKVEGTPQNPTSLSSQGELTSLGRNRFSNTPLVTGLADVITDDLASATGQDVSGDGDGDEEELEQKRYLVQRWEGGTICDMTGKARAVEVQYHCSTVGTDHIALLRETALCEYLLVIHTPRLCSEPLFVDGGGGRKAGIGGSDDSGKIDCRPILSDEDLEKWKASEAEKAKKKAAHDAAVAEEIERKKHQKVLDEALHSAQEALVNPPLESQQPTIPAEESNESDPAKSEQIPTSSEQTVLDGVSGTDTTAGSPAASSSSESKPTAPKSDTEDPGAVVMDPITVFFDTDTGQIYMDENGPQVSPRTTTGGDATRERGAGQPSNRGTAQQGRAQNRNNAQAGNADRGEGPPPTLEELTKALRESLGAVLRDLRDEGGAAAAGGGAQARPPRPLSELIAALQDSSKLPFKSRKGKQSKGQSGKGSSKLKKAKAEQKEWKESEHGKLLQMYQTQFKVKEDEKEEE